MDVYTKQKVDFFCSLQVYAAQTGNQAQADRRQRSNVQEPGQTSDELEKSVLIVVDRKDQLQLQF